MSFRRYMVSTGINIPGTTNFSSYVFGTLALLGCYTSSIGSYISGQPVGSIFSADSGTESWSQNVGNWLPTYAA